MQRAVPQLGRHSLLAWLAGMISRPSVQLVDCADAVPYLAVLAHLHPGLVDMPLVTRNAASGSKGVARNYQLLASVLPRCGIVMSEDQLDDLRRCSPQSVVRLLQQLHRVTVKHAATRRQSAQSAATRIHTLPMPGATSTIVGTPSPLNQLRVKPLSGYDRTRAAFDAPVRCLCYTALRLLATEGILGERIRAASPLRPSSPGLVSSPALLRKRAVAVVAGLHDSLRAAVAATMVSDVTIRENTDALSVLADASLYIAVFEAVLLASVLPCDSGPRDAQDDWSLFPPAQRFVFLLQALARFGMDPLGLYLEEADESQEVVPDPDTRDVTMRAAARLLSQRQSFSPTAHCAIIDALMRVKCAQFLRACDVYNAVRDICADAPRFPDADDDDLASALMLWLSVIVSEFPRRNSPLALPAALRNRAIPPVLTHCVRHLHQLSDGIVLLAAVHYHYPRLVDVARVHAPSSQHPDLSLLQASENVALLRRVSERLHCPVPLALEDMLYIGHVPDLHVTYLVWLADLFLVLQRAGEETRAWTGASEVMARRKQKLEAIRAERQRLARLTASASGPRGHSPQNSAARRRASSAAASSTSRPRHSVALALFDAAELATGSASTRAPEESAASASRVAASPRHAATCMTLHDSATAAAAATTAPPAPASPLRAATLAQVNCAPRAEQTPLEHSKAANAQTPLEHSKAASADQTPRAEQTPPENSKAASEQTPVTLAGQQAAVEQAMFHRALQRQLDAERDAAAARAAAAVQARRKALASLQAQQRALEEEEERRYQLLQQQEQESMKLYRQELAARQEAVLLQEQMEAKRRLQAYLRSSGNEAGRRFVSHVVPQPDPRRAAACRIQQWYRRAQRRRQLLQPVWDESIFDDDDDERDDDVAVDGGSNDDSTTQHYTPGSAGASTHCDDTLAVGDPPCMSGATLPAVQPRHGEVPRGVDTSVDHQAVASASAASQAAVEPAQAGADETDDAADNPTPAPPAPPAAPFASVASQDFGSTLHGAVATNVPRTSPSAGTVHDGVFDAVSPTTAALPEDEQVCDASPKPRASADHARDGALDAAAASLKQEGEHAVGATEAPRTPAQGDSVGVAASHAAALLEDEREDDASPKALEVADSVGDCASHAAALIHDERGHAAALLDEREHSAALLDDEREHAAALLDGEREHAAASTSPGCVDEYVSDADSPAAADAVLEDKQDDAEAPLTSPHADSGHETVSDADSPAPADAVLADDQVHEAAASASPKPSDLDDGAAAAVRTPLTSPHAESAGDAAALAAGFLEQEGEHGAVAPMSAWDAGADIDVHACGDGHGEASDSPALADGNAVISSPCDGADLSYSAPFAHPESAGEAFGHVASVSIPSSAMCADPEIDHSAGDLHHAGVGDDGVHAVSDDAVHAVSDDAVHGVSDDGIHGVSDDAVRGASDDAVHGVSDDGIHVDTADQRADTCSAADLDLAPVRCRNITDARPHTAPAKPGRAGLTSSRADEEIALLRAQNLRLSLELEQARLVQQQQQQQVELQKHQQQQQQQLDQLQHTEQQQQHQLGQLQQAEALGEHQHQDADEQEQLEHGHERADVDDDGDDDGEDEEEQDEDPAHGGIAFTVASGDEDEETAEMYERRQQRLAEVRLRKQREAQQRAQAARNRRAEASSRAARRAGPSNRLRVRNAVLHVLLAGAVNQDRRLAVLAALDTDKRHENFLIMFRGPKTLSLVAVYALVPSDGHLERIYGPGPDIVGPGDAAEFFKYDSGARQFRAMPVRSFSVAVDAFTIASHATARQPAPVAIHRRSDRHS